MPVLGTIGAAVARGFGLFGAIAAAVDPYFKYVTMLLPGNGTNGAQNNTFLDSGPNTLTITRNGNTTQGTFTPYGSNWSNYFSYNATAANYLTSNSLSLSGDFTIEGYVYWDGIGSIPNMFTLGDSFTSTGIEVYLGGGTNWVVYSNNATRITGAAGVKGQWTYIAVTRSGSTVTMYINGVSQGTWTSSATFSGTIRVGAEFYNGTYYSSMSGYISNFRVNNTTAINQVPTTPLTAVSGTIFLTCQSNRFIDNSGNGYTITVNGSPSVQRFSPFSPSASYSTSVVGGSGYFDGSGDYLSMPDNAAFTLGSGDWCSEGWVYATYFPNYARLWGQGVAGGSSNSSLDLFMNNGSGTSNATALCVRTKVNGSGSDYLTSNLTINQWYHIAVYRLSGTIYVAINGTVSTVRSTAGSMADSTADYVLGANSGGTGGEFWQGYIANHRLVVGNAVYTASNFTPPTAPLTAITNTQLLVNMTNGGIIDNAMMNDLETVGSAQISTSVSKFGGGSINLSGGANWLLIASSQNFSMGTGDFTIEAWVYPTSSLSAAYNVVFSVNATGGLYFGNTTTGFGLRASSVGDICVTTVPSVNTWTHIAVTRSGTTVRLFYNGVQQNSATSSQNFVVGTGNIGSDGSGSNNWPGYIDDLRITKGYARYTANFSVPTAAFPTQ